MLTPEDMRAIKHHPAEDEKIFRAMRAVIRCTTLSGSPATETVNHITIRKLYFNFISQ